MVRVLVIFVVMALTAATSLSANAGLRRIYPDEVCMGDLQKYFGGDVLINYDYDTKKTFVATPSASGKFVVYAPNGENVVDGRNCLSDNKKNSSQYLSQRLQAAADHLPKEKPYYGMIGELHGNPAEFQKKVSDLDSVLKSCSNVTDPELKQTVGNITKQYFGSGSASPGSAGSPSGGTQ